MLTIIDEHTRTCLAIHVKRKLNSQDVLHVLAKLFLQYGPPKHVRSDNGPESAAKAVRHWLGKLQVTTLFITPASPWENGYNESFNGKPGDPREGLIIQHNIAVAGGVSGSPVLDLSSGEVIAIVSGGNVVSLEDGARTPSASDVNFAQRIDVLRDLLEGKAFAALANDEAGYWAIVARDLTNILTSCPT